jgi:twitching motility protein PilT
MSPLSAVARTEWSRQLARALISSGQVQEESLAPLLSEAAESGASLGVLLITRAEVPASVVVTTLAQLARLPAVDLQVDTPSPEVANLIPSLLAQDHQALAIRVVGKQVVVAFAEPPEAGDVRSLGELVGYEVVPVLGDPVAIDRYLGGGNGTAVGSAAAPPPPPPPPPPPDGVAPPLPGELQGAKDLAKRGGSRTLGTTELRLHVDDLLRYTVSIGASDLHLTTNMQPTVRLHGALRPMEDMERLDHNTLRDMIFGILPQTQRERFEAEHELDTSHTIAGVGRFRVNVCLQRGTIAVALRPIPHEIPEFHTLGLPEAIRTFTDLRRGLVLVTGPTGSGKSTSLASLIDIINRSKPLHIVTVEDPIEFLHSHKRSVISQREVGADTASFSEALRRVLRQDPDVILVGELRDLETIATALTAAETGHLVFATLHTQDAPSTIDRVIDVFPPNQQDQIRIQLGSSLQGVVTQQLVPTAGGDGRCVAAEVLMCTPAIQNLIRGAKTHQIYSLMQTGGQYGMQTMDQSLATLVTQGVVTRGMALDRCRSEEDFRNHLHGM